MIKRLLLVILILILGVAGYYWYMFSRKSGGNSGPKQAPLAVSTHSDKFNGHIGGLMNAYFDMKAAFVEADSVKAKEACRKMQQLIDSVDLKEIKARDTLPVFLSDSMFLASMKDNAKTLLQQTDITEMRMSFKDLSENLYPFLKGIHYSGIPLYWQSCPMAFGEGRSANWISNSMEIINPYLGKHHPEYKAGMLNCGEIQDTIKAQ